MLHEGGVRLGEGGTHNKDQYLTMWTHETTHVLHQTQKWELCSPTEGKFPSDICQSHPLYTLG